MPICKHCGEPIHQTRGGSWMHMDGSRIDSCQRPKQDPAWPGVVNNWPIRGDE